MSQPQTTIRWCCCRAWCRSVRVPWRVVIGFSRVKLGAPRAFGNEQQFLQPRYQLGWGRRGQTDVQPPSGPVADRGDQASEHAVAGQLPQLLNHGRVPRPARRQSLVASPTPHSLHNFEDHPQHELDPLPIPLSARGQAMLLPRRLEFGPLAMTTGHRDPPFVSPRGLTKGAGTIC
jgi:hypothetical protein